jgi:ribulose-5-phosphate 4-epimerase/fuculose-1-phosphate aldolase
LTSSGTDFGPLGAFLLIHFSECSEIVPKVKFPLNDPEFVALLEYSARLGRDPLMVQGSTGNTSTKTGDTLWIKASGRWLANAEDEPMFVPVDLSAARYATGHNTDPSLTANTRLRASVETAMHCVIPWRVVIHVHAVNSIAWAVRRDAEEQLEGLLRGVPWKWIPYVASGLALAKRIERAVFAEPGTQAFILGNHGIVVAGPDCVSAYAMLMEIERRIALPSRPGVGILRDSSLPAVVRWLAEDPISRRILSGGYLFPCHALFLRNVDPCNVGSSLCDLAPEEMAALQGLAEVVSRIPPAAAIRYLTQTEVAELLATDVYHSGQRQTADSVTVA